MTNLFSLEWMQSYKACWNAEPELADVLAKINFSSVIGYGFIGDPHPTGVITIVQGRAVSASGYDEQPLNWDLRSDHKHWQKWLTKSLDMTELSMACITRKLKFEVGDYLAMIKDPRMVGPFIKSFTVMGQVRDLAIEST